MSGEKKPATRRDLLRPAQLLGLSAIAAVFAGVVTLMSMGFFSSRFAPEAGEALVVALVAAGGTFVVTVVVLALLMLAVQPAQVTHPVDRPVLIARDEAVAAEHAAKEAASGKDAPAGGEKPAAH